jgi:hypothetical protein
MYEILLFSGGVYRFDELAEFVEDIGGLVLKKDIFEISRGEYFLAEEIHVLLIVPQKESGTLRSLSDDIKGEIEDLNIQDDQKYALLSSLSIYDVLCKAGSWINAEKLKSSIDCPCYAILCNETNGADCTLDRLDELLMDMCSMEIIEYRVSDEGVEYQLKN